MSENHPLPSAAGGAGTRRKGRELGLQALYQIEITGDASAAAVESFLSHFEGTPKAKEFARRLVSGVVSQKAETDRRIEQSTENWKLARMAKVDLIILRMGSWSFSPESSRAEARESARIYPLRCRFSKYSINALSNPMLVSTATKSMPAFALSS